MKKILSITLSLALLLSLLCMGVAFAATDYTGTWYTTLYGVEMILTLNSGNRYTVNVGGESDGSDGTWEVTATGIILDKGSPSDETSLTYDAQAETLSGDVAGMQLVFTRENSSSAFAAARTDATAADYAGSWEATLFVLGDVQIETNAADLSLHTELSMTIDGNVNNFTIVLQDVNTTLALTPEYADGAMILTISDGATTYTVTCQLLEDGTMLATFPAELFGQEASYLLSRI